MKKSLKYIICVIISIAITATVLLLPSLYYKASDQNSKNQISVEAFSINAPKSNLTANNMYDLINSDSAVWIKNTSSTSADILTESALSAVNSLKPFFEANGEEVFAFNTFSNDDNIKLTSFMSATVSGSVDEIPMSSTLYSIDFSGTDFYNATIVIDITTNIIYEFQIYYSNVINEIEDYGSQDYSIDEYVANGYISLAKYWGIPEDKIINLYSNDNSFWFSFFKDFFINIFQY